MLIFETMYPLRNDITQRDIARNDIAWVSLLILTSTGVFERRLSLVVFACWQPVRLSLIYDNYLELITASIVLSVCVAVFSYAVSFRQS